MPHVARCDGKEVGTVVELERGAPRELQIDLRDQVCRAKRVTRLLVAASRSLGAAVTVGGGGILEPLCDGLPALVEIAGELTCPWLGIYGEVNGGGPDAEVARLRDAAASSQVATDVVVYPRRVEELVRPHAGVDEFQIVFRRREGLDDILIRIDPSPSLSLAERDGLGVRLAEDLRTGLGIRTTVEMAEPGSLPRWDHKAKRVKDERTEVPF